MADDTGRPSTSEFSGCDTEVDISSSCRGSELDSSSDCFSTQPAETTKTVTLGEENKSTILPLGGKQEKAAQVTILNQLHHQKE